MERDEDHAALYAAIDRLPPVQARRVYARFIPGAERGPDRQGRGCGGAQRPGGDQQGTAGLKKYLDFLSKVHPKTQKIRLIGEEGQAPPVNN